MMECLQELCGTIIDTTVFTTDGKRAAKPLHMQELLVNLERIVNLRAKRVELESGFKHR